MKDKTVIEIATTELTTISRQGTVAQAAKLMMENNLRNVLIVDEGVFEYGILTVSDLAHFVTKQIDLNTTIKDVHYHVVKQVPQDLSVLEASFLIRENMGYLCVVDSKKRLLGIVSMSNVVSSIDGDLVTGNIRLGHIIGKTKAKVAKRSDTLESVFHKVNHTSTEAVIVCDGAHKCIGIITKRDLIKLIIRRFDMTTPVEQVMRSPLVTVDEDATIKDALELMSNKRFKRIVVVEKSGELMGILTREEMLDIVYNKWSQVVREKDLELKKLNAELSKTNEEKQRMLKLLGDVMDSTDDLIFYKDLEYRYLGCNIAFAKFVGKTVEEIVGKADFELFDDYYADLFRTTDSQVIQTHAKISNCYWARVGEQKAVFLSVKKSPLIDKNGVVMGIIGISRDITEQKDLEDSLTRQHKFVQAILNMQEQMIFVTGDGQKITEANKRFLDFFGVKSVEQFHEKHDNFSDFFVKKASYALNKKGSFWLPHILLHPNLDHKLELSREKKSTGEKAQKTLHKSFLVKADKFSGLTSYLVSLTDISSMEAESRTLEKMATTDQLTKIYNRMKFGNLMEAEIARSRKTKKPVSLIMMDIDHFKNINDTYGHQTGDYALVTTVEIMAGLIRSEDIFARWGGEEFMVLLPGANTEAACSKAESFRKAIEGFNYIEPMHITCSFGVAELCADDTMDSLIKRADEALYEAKKTGRNKVVKR